MKKLSALLFFVSSIAFGQSQMSMTPVIWGGSTANVIATGGLNVTKAAGSKATLGATSSTAVHQVNGGWQVTTRSISGNLTVDTTTTDYLIFADVSSAALTITLPTPTVGRILIIKDSTGNSNTNAITVARHSAEKIEGIGRDKVLQTNWGSWTFTSDGTDWFML